MPGHSKSPAVKALHAAGVSVERLVHVLGCSQSEMSTALRAHHRCVPEIQTVIAAVTGREPADLWPRFYERDGTLRDGAAVLERPARPSSWHLSQMTHAEIVARLQACGQGGAIRLLPVGRSPGATAPQTPRPRSLPPLIPRRAA